MLLTGVTGKRALLVIGGGAPHWVTVGDSADGVKLISISGDTAVIDLGGTRQTLKLGENGQLSGGGQAATGTRSITLMAQDGGNFMTEGQINGIGVRFLVDTGASYISMNLSDAKRLGIDYEAGQKIIISTANGPVRSYRVKLDEVRIGDITVNGVDGVVQGNDSLPVILLGMSFLNRMEMHRDGEKMVLTKRY